MGTASKEINGSKIECRFGIRMPISVGNTTLCVIGKLSGKLNMQCYCCLFTDTLPSPVNLRCMDSEVPRRLLISWDVVIDGSSSCARSSIVHDVTV